MPPDTTNYLEFNNVTVAFNDQPVLRIDALNIPTPSIIAVLGPSGSGKSTFAALIGDFLPATAGVNGEHRKRGTVSIMTQDAFGAMNPLMSILKQVALTAGSITAAAAVLEKVGLAKPLHNRFPLQLSGGQRQRAAIAFALGTQPDFLIADEVTSALDPVATAELVSTLRELISPTKTTLLFITHDRAAAAALCDTAIMMRECGDGSFAAQLATEQEWNTLRQLSGAIPTTEQAP